MLAHLTYDGLGRLIRKDSSPVGDPNAITTEDYYYDGVRRIQEVREQEQPESTETEYIYAPDYVDEFAFQIDPAGRVFYILQDANYNVVALCGTGVSPVVAIQYAYTPYGEILATDVLDPNAPASVIGHQGLFFIRLNAPDPAAPALEPDAIGLYHNRNRMYSPHLGRFMSRDVNETALPIITALAFNAQTLDILISPLNGPVLYADGMNLYIFAGASPLCYLDPAGLSASSWLAGKFLEATGGDDSWLDDREFVGKVSFGFGLAGAGLLGGAFIVASTPAIVAAAQSFQMWVATSAGGGGAAWLTGFGGRFGPSLQRLGNAANDIRIIYSARVLIRARRASDMYHNFPMTFDRVILRNGSMTQNGTYVQWAYNGVINGVRGMYELGGQLSGGGILRVEHRFFRRGG